MWSNYYDVTLDENGNHADVDAILPPVDDGQDDTTTTPPTGDGSNNTDNQDTGEDRPSLDEADLPLIFQPSVLMAANSILPILRG